MLEPGTTLNEKYRLDRPIGHGGMGMVWQAERLGWSSPVAVKLINLELLQQSRKRGEHEPQSQLLQRFFSEARTAAAIRSPHVVQILDHGVDPILGLPFIVMELLQGETLEQLLERTPQLDIGVTAHILSHVARALTRLHEAQMVHRDLKPSNIFLVNNDGEVLAKLLDFGITRMQPGALGSAQLTATGEQLGTPYYMSPEQIRGLKTVDFRADIWALGVIAFECLTSRRPFEGDTLGALTLKICVEPLPRASAYASVPKGLQEWFEKAVTRDRALTFTSARAAAEALKALAPLNVFAQQRTQPEAPPSARPSGAPRAASLERDLETAETSAAISSSMQPASEAQPRTRRAQLIAPLAAATAFIAVAAGVALHSTEGTSPAPSGSALPDAKRLASLTGASAPVPGASVLQPAPLSAAPTAVSASQATPSAHLKDTSVDARDSSRLLPGSASVPVRARHTAGSRFTESAKKTSVRPVSGNGEKAVERESQPGTLPDGLINDRL